jgi:hypothetical protein
VSTYGLRVWNASGNLLCDVSSRLSRFVGSYTIDTTQASGSVTDAGLLHGDVWYSFQPTQIWGFINMDVSRPVFTVSGDTISWTYSAANGTNNMRIPGVVFYGVK